MIRQHDTKYKKQIVELFSKKHILTAQEIKDAFPAMDPSTVYRTLKRLQTTGTIKEVVLRSDKAFYELSDHDHAHFICNSCGEIEAIEMSKEQLSPTLPKHTIQTVNLELSGLCPKCE